MLTLILFYYPLPTHFQKGLQMQYTEKGSTSGNEITKSMRKASNTIIIKLQARVPFQHSFADFPPPNPTTSWHLCTHHLPVTAPRPAVTSQVSADLSDACPCQTPQKQAEESEDTTVTRKPYVCKQTEAQKSSAMKSFNLKLAEPGFPHLDC